MQGVRSKDWAYSRAKLGGGVIALCLHKNVEYRRVKCRGGVGSFAKIGDIVRLS